MAVRSSLRLAQSLTTVIIIRVVPASRVSRTELKASDGVSSGLISPRRFSLAWAMAVILFIAADLAALRQFSHVSPTPDS